MYVEESDVGGGREGGEGGVTEIHVPLHDIAESAEPTPKKDNKPQTPAK